MAITKTTSETDSATSPGISPRDVSTTAIPLPPSPALPESLHKIQQLLDAGRVNDAFQHAVGRSSGGAHFQNAQAVCLMRLGKSEAAVKILRGIVLVGGGVTFREHIPEIYKINLATALAMNGNSLGARRALSEIDREDHPHVQVLRAALARWEKELSVMEYLQWKLGIAVDRPVTIDGTPGALA